MLRLDSARLASHAPAAVLVVVAAIAAAGLWAFWVSLRPCRLRLDPGSLVTYALTTTYTPLSEDGDRAVGAPRSWHEEINLICIGTGNEAALIAGGGRAAANQDEVTILSFGADGTARRSDGAGAPGDEGKALGFFDFNLLPLPPGSEQSWNVSLVYGALPPDRRQVQGRVRRIANSSRPEFQLRLPTIEWLNQRNRYQQVKDLVCTYRYDAKQGLVDRAKVTCAAGLELDDGNQSRYRVEVELALVDIRRAQDQPGALRDLALASAETQGALQARRLERIAPLLERLRGADVREPRLRALAQRLADDARGAGARPLPHAEQQRGWAVELRFPASRVADAQRVYDALRAAGLPAHGRRSADLLEIRVGTYETQDQRVLAAVRRVAPREAARWVAVP